MRVEHTASTTSDLPGIASGREDMCNVRVNVGAGLARLDSDFFLQVQSLSRFKNLPRPETQLLSVRG